MRWKNRGWSASRRTAASSSARSASARPTRSTNCARCWTNSSAGGWPNAQRPTPSRELRTLVEKMEKRGRRATMRRRYYARQPRVPRPPASTSPATPSCCIYRRLVNELHLYRPRDARRRPAACRRRCASTATIVERIAARQRGGGRPAPVRARDGEPRTDAPRGRRRPAAAAHGAPRGERDEAGRSPSTAAATAGRDRPLVVVCVDGCEPDYIEPGDRAPASRRSWRALHGRGTCLNADCVVPSFTNPNNLSIVTGAPPSVHGICGNYFFDRDAQAGSDDERRRSTCAPARCSRRSPTPAPRSPWSPPRTSCAMLLGHKMKGICFSSEKSDQATLAANGIADVLGLVGMPVPSVYSARTVGVRVRRGRQAAGARPART